MRADVVLENLRHELSKPNVGFVRISVADAQEIVDKTKKLESLTAELLRWLHDKNDKRDAAA